MEIEYKNDEVYDIFYNLSEGHVFIDPKSNKVYMKTKLLYTENDYAVQLINAIKFEDGSYCYFDTLDKIKKIKSKLVIEE